MKAAATLLLLSMSYLCHKAEKKSTRYEAGFLRELSGMFACVSVLIWIL